MLFRIIFIFCSTYSVFAGIHESTINEVNCTEVLNTSKWQTHTDSFLLSEGESLFLDCGVCKNCSAFAVECTKGLDMEAWTVQRSRYLGYGGPIDGKFDEKPFDLPSIRLRLHERLWPGANYYPGHLEQFLRSNYTLAESDQRMLSAQPKFEPPPLAGNINLYILVSKVNEDVQVLRPPKRKRKLARIQLGVDTVYFKQTRVDDTGVYYCFWNGNKLKEWTVTVVRAQQEPYRQVLLPTVYDEHIKTMIDQAIKETPELGKQFEENITPPDPLEPKHLVDHNLVLFTSWTAWSACVPCTKAEDLSGMENITTGFQMRVGTCRVRILDPFHPVRPNSLSLMVGDLLKSYAANGLPCRSHAIKDAMLYHGPPEVKYRPSEIQHRKCGQACPELPENDRIQVFRHPTRIQLRINDGEQLMISCPIRGALRGPISWYYSYSDQEQLINFTRDSLLEQNLVKFGSPSAFVLEYLKPVPMSTLYQDTRGRFRLDPGQNLFISEAMSEPPSGEEILYHLVCLHGEPRTRREQGFSDWAGIIDIQVIKRVYAVVVLSKLSQIVLLLIPFILACGTFVVIVMAIQAERNPKMRAAAEGFTSKVVQ